MESRGPSAWNGASMRASQMRKIDCYGQALLLPVVYITDIVQRHSSGWAGTQINVASLSVPQFYPEYHDIFVKNSSFMQFSKHD